MRRVVGAHGAHRALELGKAALRPGLRRVARAPGASMALFAVIAGYGWAGLNALYLQESAVPPPYVLPENSAGPTPLASPPPAPPVYRPAETDQIVTMSIPPHVERIARSDAAVGNRDTFAVQTVLQQLGYFDAKIDGLYGPKTAGAIRQFETAMGVEPAGKLTPVLYELLDAAYAGAGPAAPLTSRNDPAPEAVAEPEPAGEPAPQETTQSDPLARIALAVAEPEGTPTVSIHANNAELVRLIQRGLASLGFEIGSIDGIAGETTRREIRRFETMRSLEPTGEISPELVELLRIANAHI